MTLAPRPPSAPDPGPIVAAVLAASAGLSALWFRLDLPLLPCAFRELTGMPCLTCGTTRLCEALLAGDILGAAGWNPLVFAALAATATWAFWSTGARLAGTRGWRLALDRRDWMIVRLAAVPLAAANWAYVIWRGV